MGILTTPEHEKGDDVFKGQQQRKHHLNQLNQLYRKLNQLNQLYRKISEQGAGKRVCVNDTQNGMPSKCDERLRDQADVEAGLEGGVRGWFQRKTRHVKCSSYCERMKEVREQVLAIGREALGTSASGDNASADDDLYYTAGLKEIKRAHVFNATLKRCSVENMATIVKTLELEEGFKRFLADRGGDKLFESMAKFVREHDALREKIGTLRFGSKEFEHAAGQLVRLCRDVDQFKPRIAEAVELAVSGDGDAGRQAVYDNPDLANLVASFLRGTIWSESIGSLYQ